MKTFNKYAPYVFVGALVLSDQINKESLEAQIDDTQDDACDAAQAEIQMVQQKILDAGLTLETARVESIKLDACRTSAFAWEMHDLLQVRISHVCEPGELNSQVGSFLQDSIDPKSLSNAHIKHCRN